MRCLPSLSGRLFFGLRLWLITLLRASLGLSVEESSSLTIDRRERRLAFHPVARFIGGLCPVGVVKSDGSYRLICLERYGARR